MGWMVDVPVLGGPACQTSHGRRVCSWSCLGPPFDVISMFEDRVIVSRSLVVSLLVKTYKNTSRSVVPAIFKATCLYSGIWCCLLGGTLTTPSRYHRHETKEALLQSWNPKFTVASVASCIPLVSSVKTASSVDIFLVFFFVEILSVALK